MIPRSFHCTILPILLKEPHISSSIICPFLSSGHWVLLLFYGFYLFSFRILCQNWMGLLDLDGERKWMGFNWALCLTTVIISSGFLDTKKELVGLFQSPIPCHSVSYRLSLSNWLQFRKGYRAEAYESLEFWPQVLLVFLRKRFIVLIRFSQKSVICLQKKRLRATDTLAFGS